MTDHYCENGRYRTMTVLEDPGVACVLDVKEMTSSSVGANCSVVHEVGAVIADEVVQPAQSCCRNVLW